MGYKFLKSTELEANPIHAMDFAFVKLFSVTCILNYIFLESARAKLDKLANKL